MMKRKLRSVLALLLCCAMLLSNLGFAEELTELAAEVAQAASEPAVEAAEPAPEPEPEIAPEPEVEAAPEAEPVPEPEVVPDSEAESGEAPVEELPEPEITEPGGGIESEPVEPEVIAPEVVEEAPAPELIADAALVEDAAGLAASASDCQHEDSLQPINDYIRYEDFSEELGDSQDDGEGNHIVRGTHIFVKRCTRCGEEIEEPETEEPEVMTEPHTWDGEGRTCEICHYEQECENHVGEPVEEWNPWLVDDNSPQNTVVRVDSGEVDLRPDPDVHYVKGLGYQQVRCDTCGATWVEEAEVIVQFEHEWNDEGTTCEACGYTNGCPHENKEWNEAAHRIPFDCVEEDAWDAPQQLQGGKQHRAWGVDGMEWYCDDCGMSWGFVANDGDTEHWITEDHQWVERDEGIICWICGEKNTCDHANREVTTEYVPHDGDYDNLLAYDRETHTLDADKEEHWFCPDCGMDGYDVSYVGEISVEHVYFDDDEHDPTHCDVCGYYNDCDTDHAGAQQWDDILWDEPPQPEDDKTHKGIGRHATGEWCADCEDFVSLTFDGPTGEQTWHHNWVDGVCDNCNMECPHTGDFENNEGILWEKGSPVDMQDGEHHSGTGRKATWKWCYECGQNFDIQYKDDGLQYYEEPHGWNTETEPATCWQCDATNPCDHSEAIRIPVDGSEYALWWEDGDPKDDGDGHHSGMARRATWSYCPECGIAFDIDFLDDEPQHYTREHGWDTDSWPIVCGGCGAPLDCDHEGAEMEGDPWYDPLENGESWDPEVGSRTPEGHEGIPAIENTNYYCPKCDLHYTIHDDEAIATGEHDWSNELNEDGHSYCRICGYENTCDHSEWEDEEWQETDWDHEGGWLRVQNSTSCEVWARNVAQKRCLNCDLTFDWHVVNDGFTRIGDHEWNRDDGGQTCIWCEYQNSCDHIAHLDADYVEIYGEGYDMDPDNENHRVLEPEGDEACHAICHWWIDGYCHNCDTEFHYDDDEHEYQGDHIWDDENGAECIFCHTPNSCTHENAETRIWLERNNSDYRNDGIINCDENGHAVYIRRCRMMYCRECDTEYDWQDIGIENEDDVREFLEQEGFNGDFDFDVKSSVLSGTHIWNGNDGGYECMFCGWGNSCGHENNEYIEDWYDLTDESVTDKGRTDIDHHVIEHTEHHTRVYCPVCDQEIIFNGEDEEWDGEHEWRRFEEEEDDQYDEEHPITSGAICDLCGYVIPCEHLEAMTRLNDWWELAEDEDFTKIDANGHTGKLQHVQEYYCEQCDARWGWEIIEGPEVTTKPHDWYYDEERGGVYCGVCDYESTCKHPDAVKLEDEDYDFDGATIDSKTKTTHTAKKAWKIEYFYCPDCDLVYQTRTKGTYTVEHWWDDETGTKCWVCGYANPCKHPADQVEYREWCDPDASRGGIISSDADGHTMYAIRVGNYHCYYCDTDWGWHVVAEDWSNNDDGTWTEEHNWNDELICDTCGYENACDHPDREKREDWYEDVECSDFDANGHTATGYHFTRYYCPDCECEWVEADMDEEGHAARVELPGEHQWDSENGAKTCWVCGYTNPCKHPASMVYTETREEPDGENYPYDGVVTSGAKGCTVFMRTIEEKICDQCGTTISWRVVKSGYKRSGAHEWNYKDGGRYCKYCDYENECEHFDSEPTGSEWYEDVLDDDDPEKFVSDSEGHSYQATHYVEMHCDECGATYRVDDGKETLSEGHNWHWDSEKQTPVCDLCEYEMTPDDCAHKRVETAPNKWYDVNYSKGGITSADANGHKGWFWEVTGYYCPDCDTHIDVTANALAKQKTMAHDWSYDEGGAYCVVCGYQNTCKHAKATVEDEWLEPYEDSENESAELSLHKIRGTYIRELHCPTCDAYFRKEEENFTLVGPHEWEWDDEMSASICRICGAENECAHENSEPRSWFEVDLSEDIERDAKQHTLHLIQVKLSYCNDCGAEFDVTETPVEEPIVGDHEWGEDDCCIYCNYQNTCAHTHKLTSTWLGVPEKVQIKNKNVSGHTITCVTYTVTHCKDCGAYLGTKQNAAATKDIVEPHIYNETECELCGWKNACTHEGTTEEVTGKAAYGDQYTSRDEKTHVAYGEEYTVQHCKKCDATWGYKVIEAGVQIEGNHVWDGASGTYCTECGYLNTCAHKNTKTEDDEEDAVTIVLPELTNDETHTTLVKQTTYTLCENCGAKFDYEQGDMTLKTEAHQYGDEDNVCTVCRYSDDDRVALEELSFGDVTSITLGVGETFTPAIIKDPPTATDKIEYKSGKTSIFTVDAATGEIKAKATGKNVVLTVENANNPDVKATLMVTVKAKPTSIKLDAKTMTLGVGQSKAIKATLSSGSAGQVRWATSNSSVAACEDGVIVARGYGTATITATTYNGKSATCAVTVLHAPSAENVDLELSTNSMAMAVGETATAAVRFIDSIGEVTVESESGNITVTRESDGTYTVEAIEEGTASIAVKAGEDTLVEKEIEIIPSPYSVDLTHVPETLGVGEPWTLEAEPVWDDESDYRCKVSFTSNNPAILDVDAQRGELTAKKVGSASITVKAGEASRTVTITVAKAPTSIKLDKANVEMIENQVPVSLTATVLPKGSADNVTWYSDDTDVVLVDGGTLIAQNPGVATVSASVYNSKDADKPLMATCTVFVYREPEEGDLELNLSGDKLGNGESITASPEFVGDAGGECVLSAEGEGKVTITEKSGKYTITGTATGEVDIVAEVNGVEVARETITVTAKPTGVSTGVTGNKVALSVGESFEFQPVPSPAGTASNLTVTSSAPKKVAVETFEDEDGVFTVRLTAGSSTGSAKITLKTYNSKTATVNVTVGKAPTGISLPESVRLVLDEDNPVQGAIKATLEPSGAAGTVEWWSSDDGIVEVDENGNLTPKRIGRAFVTAHVRNYQEEYDIEESCEVRVYEAPRADELDEDGNVIEPGNIRLEPVKGTIGVGETTASKLVYIGSAGAIKVNSYAYVNKNKDSKVVSLDTKTGKIKGLAKGTAHLKVTMYNDVVLEAEIEVVAKPTKIQFAEYNDDGELKAITKKTLTVDEEYTPEYLFTAKSGAATASVTLTSNKPKIVRVDAEKDEYGNVVGYKLVALKTGKATITAKTHNNFTATLTVTVSE